MEWEWNTGMGFCIMNIVLVIIVCSCNSLFFVLENDLYSNFVIL